MSTNSRKRNRQRKACLACRRRKSKCDCRRPVCDTCKRRQTEHICIFDDLYPFQQSLRMRQPEPIDPSFPAFDIIHLPQIIALGNRVPDARRYSQNLSEFQKSATLPPGKTSPSSLEHDTNNRSPQQDNTESKNLSGDHSEQNSSETKVGEPSSEA